MTINYGKREAGALTAASPGDTLYIPLAFYNDSGDSESIGNTLAVTDIEVFKNGGVAQRATDSGYAILGDTGNFDNRVGFKGISIQLFNTADDASFYAAGSTYWVGIDSVTVDGKTVRFWPAIFEIGQQKVNVVEIDSDTGAADQLQKAFASGFADTGVNERFARIQSDVDTGLRVHIDDSDTGVKDVIADLDTGLRDYMDNTDTGLRKYIDNLDTGIKQRFNALAEDTGGVNVNSIQGDTGAAGWLKAAFASGFTDTGLNERFARIQSDVDTGLRVHIDDSDTGVKDAIADLDTGIRGRLNTLAEDTGGVNVNSIQGDTGAAGWLKAIFANGFGDTGVNERLARIQSDVDTGLRVHIDDSDTGVKDVIADLDTGLRDYIDNTDTGLRARLNTLAEDTGGVNVNAIAGDTGAASWLKAAFASGFTDTGLNERLARIQSDVDTGLRIHIDDLDTGIKQRFNALAEDTGGVNVNAIAGDTGAASRLSQFAGSRLSTTGMVDTGTLAGTKAGTIDANVTNVNETAVTGTGASGNEWRPA